MTTDTLTRQGQDRTHTGLAGIDTAKLKAMRNAQLRSCFNHFDELPYRREFVARVRGREYINDASSRNVNATWYTLESLQGGLIWIAMGDPSDADYSRLVPAALRKVRQLLIVGHNGERLERAFEGIIPDIVVVDTLAEALQHAYYYNEADSVRVVFSPACQSATPSTELGEQFKHEVNEL